MDAGKVEHAAETRRVKMLADRRGWFWPDWLWAGHEYDLPADVTEYLIGVGAAELVVTKPETEPEAKPAAKRKAG